MGPRCRLAGHRADDREARARVADLVERGAVGQLEQARRRTERGEMEPELEKAATEACSIRAVSSHSSPSRRRSWAAGGHSRTTASPAQPSPRAGSGSCARLRTRSTRPW